MEEFQHNPVLWWGVGIPVCLIVSFAVGKIVTTIAGNIESAKKEERMQRVKTAKINIQTGKVSEFTEEDQ